MPVNQEVLSVPCSIIYQSQPPSPFKSSVRLGVRQPASLWSHTALQMFVWSSAAPPAAAVRFTRSFFEAQTLLLKLNFNTFSVRLSEAWSCAKLSVHQQLPFTENNIQYKQKSTSDTPSNVYEMLLIDQTGIVSSLRPRPLLGLSNFFFFKTAQIREKRSRALLLLLGYSLLSFLASSMSMSSSCSDTKLIIISGKLDSIKMHKILLQMFKLRLWLCFQREVKYTV